MSYAKQSVGESRLVSVRKNARDFYHDRKNDLKTQEQVTKA